MKLEVKCKITTIVIILVASIALVARIFDVIKQNEILEDMEKLGMAIGINPNRLQRDIRIILALVFSAMALWSDKVAKITLVGYFSFYLIIELLVWVIFPEQNTFSMIRVEIHLLPGFIFIMALFIWWKKIYSLPIISLFACCYILFEYLFWLLLNINAYRFAEPTLPNTFLGLYDLFLGWQFWHLFIFVFTFFLLFWLLNILFQIRKYHTMKIL